MKKILLLNQAYLQEDLFHIRKLWILSLSREFKKLKGAKHENIFHCIANAETGTYFPRFELLKVWQIIGHSLYIETDYEYD